MNDLKTAIHDQVPVELHISLPQHHWELQGPEQRQLLLSTQRAAWEAQAEGMGAAHLGLGQDL